MSDLFKISFFFVIIIFYMTGCISGQFPVIHPVHEISKYDIAKQRAVYHFIRARDYDRRGLHNMAKHFYQIAYELDPESIVLRDLLIDKCIILQKYKQALTLVKGSKKIEDLSEKEKRIVANLYVKLNLVRKAVETYEKFSNLKPSERAALGRIYEHLNENKRAVENYLIYFRENNKPLSIGKKIAKIYIRGGRYNKADSLLRELNQEYKDEKDILNDLGRVSFLKGDTALAITFFDSVLSLDSNSNEAIENLAQIYIEREEFKKAINYYLKFTNEDFLTQFYHEKTLALLYYYDEQYSEASNILQSLLSFNVNDYELHYYLGIVFSAQKRFDLAEIELRKTLVLKNTFKEAWFKLCYNALQQKDKDRALKTALEFKNIMPEIAGSWRIYGYILNSRKEYKKAIKPLTKAIELDSADAVVWFELGCAYERCKYSKNAADAFRMALKINPEDDASANYLGYMWAEQGIKLDSAEILLKMALKKDPDNGAYLDSYAWIFFKKGDIPNAEKYILMALKKIDDDPIIYDHLGDIFAEKGDRERAVEAYTKSIKLDAKDVEIINKKIKSLQ